MHRPAAFDLKNAEVNREDGTRCRAVYRDTVVEKAYWGQKVLGGISTFWGQKPKRPFQPPTGSSSVRGTKPIC